MTDTTVPTGEIAQRAEALLVAVATAVDCRFCDARITLDPGPEGMAVSVVHRPGCDWLADAAMEPVCPPKVVVIHTTTGGNESASPTDQTGPDASSEGPLHVLAISGPAPGSPESCTSPGSGELTPNRRNDAALTTGDRVDPRPDEARADDAEAGRAFAERHQAEGGLTAVDDGP